MPASGTAALRGSASPPPCPATAQPCCSLTCLQDTPGPSQPYELGQLQPPRPQQHPDTATSSPYHPSFHHSTDRPSGITSICQLLRPTQLSDTGHFSVTRVFCNLSENMPKLQALCSQGAPLPLLRGPEEGPRPHRDGRCGWLKQCRAVHRISLPSPQPAHTHSPQSRTAQQPRP